MILIQWERKNSSEQHLSCFLALAYKRYLYLFKFLKHLLIYALIQKAFSHVFDHIFDDATVYLWL